MTVTMDRPPPFLVDDALLDPSVPHVPVANVLVAQPPAEPDAPPFALTSISPTSPCSSDHPGPPSYFESLDLPPECSTLPPLTLLWLASRLKRGARELAEQKQKAFVRKQGYRRKDEFAARVLGGEDEQAVKKEQETRKAAERAERRSAQAAERCRRAVEIIERNHAWYNYFNPAYRLVCMNCETCKTFVPIIDEDLEDDDEDDDERINHEITVEPFIGLKDPPAVSWTNLTFLLKILPLLAPRIARLAWKNPRLVACAAVNVPETIAKGLLPPMKVYYTSRLAHLAMKAYKTRDVSWKEPLRCFAGILVGSIGERLIVKVFKGIRAVLENAVVRASEYTYISAQLDLTLESASSPVDGVREALVYAAGIFAGFNRFKYTARGVYGTTIMRFFSETVAGFISISSQLAILIRLLRQGAANASLRGMITQGNALIFAMGVVSPVVSTITSSLVERATRPKGDPREDWKFRRYMVDFILTDPKSRDELITFGLKDWTLELWDYVKTQEAKRNYDPFKDHFMAEMRPTFEFVNGIETMVRNVVNVFLGAGVVQTGLSFHKITMCQRVGKELFADFRKLRNNLWWCYQSIFVLAAVFSVAEGSPPIKPMIDYEKHRPAAGMRIEVRNLSFAYGRDQRPVLIDINLVIEPGQSLAVVGFNGSGKTTLVKTLLGLHHHQGLVLVNGINITHYDPATLYRRTSCLFQDFNRYKLPLRDNVGLGETTRMDDEEHLNLAVTRGGADGIRDEHGWQVWLGRVNSEEMGSGKRRAAPSLRKIKKEKKGVTDEDEKGGDGVNNENGDTLGKNGTNEGNGVAKAGDAGVDNEEKGRDDAGKDKKENGDANADKNGDAVTVQPNKDSMDEGKQIRLRKRKKIRRNAGTNRNDDGDEFREVPNLCLNGPEKVRIRVSKKADGSSGLKHRNVSGGQWQRIALSRAFMRADTADLIILDEPSAALDPVAEHDLFERIHSLSNAGTGATTIFISHKLNTVRRADKIAFMEHGRIVEHGTHDELIALGGKYFMFFELQSRGFTE